MTRAVSTLSFSCQNPECEEMMGTWLMWDLAHDAGPFLMWCHACGTAHAVEVRVRSDPDTVVPLVDATMNRNRNLP